MSEPSEPPVHRFSWNEFAILDVAVTHVTPLRGNSGHSTIHFDVGGGNIGLGETPDRVAIQDSFTIQLVGENEHAILAEAFRQIAGQLDAAPRHTPPAT